MIIDCISDLHSHYPPLEGGDLLIVAGDLTARDLKEEILDFIYWLAEQDYEEKIVIAGNHDSFILHNNIWFAEQLEYISKSKYLCDSGTEFEGLKIWGSPWTKTFENMNPLCKAFTCDTEEELAEKWELIPDDIDILITHGPSFGILDKNIHDENCGSKSLYNRIKQIRPSLHFFGHIHEAYSELGGTFTDGKLIQCFNCSHVNERYQPVNKPVRIVL